MPFEIKLEVTGQVADEEEKNEIEMIKKNTVVGEKARNMSGESDHIKSQDIDENN